MPLGRSLLRDAGLGVLAVAAVAAALYAVTRTPDVEATPLVERAAPVPTATATATAEDVTALLVGAGQPGGGVPTAVADAAADLGWEFTSDVRPGGGYVSAAAGPTYVDRVPGLLRGASADVVVLASPADPAEEAEPARLAGNVAFVVDAVRDALPGAQVVLLGPVASAPTAFPVTRGVLQQVAARFGAVYVDPVGRGWLASTPGALTPTGDLTPAGRAEVARRLAADLRVVLPRTLVGT